MKFKTRKLSSFIAFGLVAALIIKSPVAVKAAGQAPDVTLKTNIGGGISQSYVISPSGSSSISLNDLSLRYYYTKNDNKQQSFYCDSAGLSMNVSPYYTDIAKDISGKFYSNYLEINFSGSHQIQGGSLNLGIRFNNSDWSSYQNYTEKKLEVIYENRVVKTVVYDASDAEPTQAPTVAPTSVPTVAPTQAPTAVPTQTPSFDQSVTIVDGWYYIKSVSAQKYLTVNGTGSGGNVEIQTGIGTQNQKWKVTNTGDGYFTLTSGLGNFMMDVSYGSADNGTNIGIYNAYSGDSQKFVAQNTDTAGIYTIGTKSTQGNKVLDIYQRKTADGTNVIQWTRSAAANQQFIFEQVDSGNNNNNQPITQPTTSAPAPIDNNTGSLVNIDSTYCMQKIQLQCSNNDTNVTAPSAYGKLTASNQNSTDTQWVLVNNGSNQFMIANAKTGYVIAPENNNASNGVAIVASKNNGNLAQYWTIQAASNDVNGDALTYRISNCANTNLCLQLSGTNFILGNYQNSSTHRFYLNTYGVDGFAGKSKNVRGNTKASVIGGALGQVVTAADFNTLSRYCSGSTPYTIIVTNNIYMSNLSKINVGKNKTIIGSYNANTLNNVHFRCISNSGNVIFKNLRVQHDSNKNANDDIQIYISDGNNFWVDHCTFPGHSSLMGSDVDKLLYVGKKADYVTISGNIFMNHKYGLILGYPNEDGVGTYSGYPQLTINNNYFYGVVTRAPGLMRYGYFHSYNNFVYDFDLGYTPYTGCNIYSEKNYFDAGRHKGAVVNDMKIGNFTDNGSVFPNNRYGYNLSGTSFRPGNCYSYSAKDPYTAKSWCQNYAGVKSGKLVYPRD